MKEVRFYIFIAAPSEYKAEPDYYHAIGSCGGLSGEEIETFARSEAMATAFVLDEISRKLKEKARTENG